jgi:sugar lactone lactonase YvrE
MGFESSSLNRRTLAMSAGAAALAAGTASRAFAQDASPVAEEGPAEGGLPPLPEGATVVASGLYNPRYIALADDGTLYVTEQGTGGEEVLDVAAPGEAEASPEATMATPVVAATPPPAEEEPPVSRGFTGQVTQVAPDGTQSVAISGLASYSIGVGPVGIAIQDGVVYFSVGGAAVEAGIEPLEGENGLHRYDPATGETTQVAEFNTYESENNPDGTDVNPNLYAVSAGDTDGRLTVNDAGSNTIFSVDAESGEFTLRGIAPDLNALTAKDEEGAITDDPPRQPVPTGGTFVGTAYHYTNLSEGWPPNGPSIVKVDGDGQFATFTSIFRGGSFVTGLAAGPDGKIYFSQLFDDPAGPPMGSVFRVNTADGTAEPVVQGLMMPHGIAFDGDGNLYVTVYALVSGPGMPAGVVARFDGIAAPA